VFNRNYGNGEFIIPSRDIWVIVYNNTNYSEGDTYADYSLTTETNFYNLSLVMSLIVIFGVGFTLLCVATDNMVYDRTAIYAQGIVAFFPLYLFIFMMKEV